MCYTAPPVSEENVTDPFSGLKFSKASHLYLFSRKNSVVTVKDAGFNGGGGGTINRTFSVAAN